MGIWADFFKLVGHYGPPLILIIIVAALISHSFEKQALPKSKRRR